MSNQLEQVKALISLREKARIGGGQKRIDSQHEKGKYTARERINMLLLLKAKLSGVFDVKTSSHGYSVVKGVATEDPVLRIQQSVYFPIKNCVQRTLILRTQFFISYASFSSVTRHRARASPMVFS